MNKTDLINKIQLTLDDNSLGRKSSIDLNIEEFIDALVYFESKTSQEIFLKTFLVLRNSILEDSIGTSILIFIQIQMRIQGTPST